MDMSVIANYFPFLMSGLKVTIQLALISIISSLILGTFLGVLRHSKIPVISPIVVAFIELTRSIPLIMYIIFIHYTISSYIFYDLNLKNILNLESTQLQSGLIALVLFTSAYIAEIVRNGLASIDKEQIDSAKALGFSTSQIMTYIFVPLALYRMAPAILAQFITLIKDTSLVSAIGLIELTRSGEFIYEQTHHELEVLIVISLIYFMICFALSKLTIKLTNKPFLKQR